MKKRGFSLVELLTVVAIISVLATLSIAILGPARARSRDARRITDLKVIQTALQQYALNEATDGNYPAPYTNYPYPVRHTLASGGSLTGPGIYGPNPTTDNPDFQKYLAKVPTDPRRRGYVYRAPACLRAGDGTAGNPTIITPAVAFSLTDPTQERPLSASEFTATPSNYCPGGSGWLAYVVYGVLEAAASTGSSGFDSLVSGDKNLVVYGPNLYEPVASAVTALSNSFCEPAINNCPSVTASTNLKP